LNYARVVRCLLLLGYLVNFLVLIFNFKLCLVAGALTPHGDTKGFPSGVAW